MILPNSVRFDVVVLDLFWGECGIGLASALGIPIVGYWGMTPSGMWMDYTGMDKKMGHRLRDPGAWGIKSYV